MEPFDDPSLQLKRRLSFESQADPSLELKEEMEEIMEEPDWCNCFLSLLLFVPCINSHHFIVHCDLRKWKVPFWERLIMGFEADTQLWS